MYALPFSDLLFQAHQVHRAHFDPNKIQVSALLSIKTGGCPEDCAYCPQSAHYESPIESTPLMQTEAVLKAAQQAKAQGASRFCLGAAWKNPKDKDIETIGKMIEGVKALGLETCATLGTLSPSQAHSLKNSGLDYYNHNIDTSPDHYSKIISTRTFDERIETLNLVSSAGMKVCCGGIVGMGECTEDRLKMIAVLCGLKSPPESVPLNMLMPSVGTPLENAAPVDGIDFVKIVAITRIALPKTYIRLSAGRESMSKELQALCFFAGANSIFSGETLLTAPNPLPSNDQNLFEKLGIQALS